MQLDLQTCYRLSKLVDKKSSRSICIKLVDNLPQTCYYQAGASNQKMS